MFMLQSHGRLWSRSFLQRLGPSWKTPSSNGWAPITFGTYRDAELTALEIERTEPHLNVEII